MAVEYPWIAVHALHNDFLRVLFVLGYFGFLLFSIFIFYMFIKAMSLNINANRFLVLSCLAFLLLYSVTLTPTTYVDVNLFLMSVFAFFSFC